MEKETKYNYERYSYIAQAKSNTEPRCISLGFIDHFANMDLLRLGHRVTISIFIFGM